MEFNMSCDNANQYNFIEVIDSLSKLSCFKDI